jgi:hypothetical protein
VVAWWFSGLGLFLLAGLLAAKGMLRSRADPELDEIDLALVLGRRRFQSRARPFLGGTVLVVAGSITLDLRQVEPAPTGIEVAIRAVAGRLLLLVPADWNLSVDLETRAAWVDVPGPIRPDSPWLRMIGRAWLARVRLIAVA